MIVKLNFIFLLFLTFVLISCHPGYKKVDNKWAYVTYDEALGKRIEYLKVDNKTFKILNAEYAKDDMNVFHKGIIIPMADSKTFNIIGNDYSKDKFQVFLSNEIVIGANPVTFKPLDFPYSRDDKTIFCGTVPMIVKDIESFKVVATDGFIINSTIASFIKDYPDYSFIDTTKYKAVIYGTSQQAETLTEKFVGFERKK